MQIPAVGVMSCFATNTLVISDDRYHAVSGYGVF